MRDSPAFDELMAAAQALPPQAAIVLGSGMTAVANALQVAHRVPYAAVPGLAATSVAGHRGCLTLGTWNTKRVLLFEGRQHYYEGHSWSDVVRSVHLAADLAAPVLLQLNAAGGIHERLGPGSLMAIRDHIEWTVPAYWRRPGPGGLGGPRPSPYSARLLQILADAARSLRIELLQGIYASVTGPSYETPAEIRALKQWGADAVGMSTAREAQTGYDLKLECTAVSLITNRAAGLSAAPLDHTEVLSTAAAQGEKLADLVGRFLGLL